MLKQIMLAWTLLFVGGNCLRCFSGESNDTKMDNFVIEKCPNKFEDPICVRLHGEYGEFLEDKIDGRPCCV